MRQCQLLSTNPSKAKAGLPIGEVMAFVWIAPCLNGILWHGLIVTQPFPPDSEKNGQEQPLMYLSKPIQSPNVIAL
jgi:hypothetical protein